MQNSKKGGRPEQWYNLDAIISIGYRISTKEATKFRIWANSILKNMILVKMFEKGYFDEMASSELEVVVDDELS